MDSVLSPRGDGLDSDVILSEKFSAPKFITDFLRNVQTGDEALSLQNLRQTLAARSNSKAETIRDVVFDHYKQFIETSKEISKLERDIYQLSSLLTEQKNLIENLMGMSGHEKKSSCSASLYSSNSAVNQQNQQLQIVMQKMDGVASVLNSLSEYERVLIQGQFVLLDANSMQPKHAVYLVMFTNNLLVGHPTPGGMAHQRHPFSIVHNYPIESLALVNVKGVGTVIADSGTNPLAEQHLIQLLVFPDQMFLRCENGRAKREWLDQMEEAKRRQQEERALVRQATIRARRCNLLSSIANRVPQQQRKKSKNGQSKADNEKEGTAEAANEENRGDTTATGQRLRAAANEEDSAWLNELVNELQDVISHRHMDEAVDMLLEWKSCQCKDAGLNAKFAGIEKQVVELLTEESKLGSLHGSPRTLSQPFQQLIALGRTVYAVELYLRSRSVALRSAARELTISEEPLSYVRQVSGLFVNDILEVCQELSPYRDQLCQVLTWSSRELSVLLSLIRRHVIEVAPTMAVLTHTWRILMSKCAQLVPIGLDLSFEVNRLAAPSLKNALETNFSNILDSIRLRNSEERWTPFSLGTDQNLVRFLEEMADIGLQIEWVICRPSSPSSVAAHRCALNLAQSGCLFARTALQLSRDLALLNTSPHLHQLSDSLMQSVWTEQLAHLTATMHKSVVHHCTSRFIISQVLPLCEKVYQLSDSGADILHQLLSTQFPHLLHFQRKPSNHFLSSKSDSSEEVANV